MSADEPQPLPPPIIPASESGIIDHAAQIMGVDLGALMQRAGAAVAEVAKEWAPKGAILIACGPGNNGGDGYVAARLLAEQGREVWLWAVSDPRSPLCDREAARLPDTVRRIAGITEGDIPALIIDAVLGAGVSGALRGGIAEAMAQLRSLGAPCLAVDLPTGLSSGEHVTPCLCLCLHAAKREAVDAGLEVRVADIGMPEQAWARVQPSCLRAWPPHAASGHKGQHGSLLVVAGWRFQGALQISAQAALRLGCDLVHAWAPGDIPLPASVVHHRRERGQPRGASEEDTYELLLLMKKVDAVLLGPGLGTDQTAIDLAATVWTYSKHLELPLVIDADALHMLAQQIREEEHPHLLLTPHKAEFAAVADLEAAQVDHAAMHTFARESRVILGKGRIDLISDGRRWQRNHGGNPRMAVGGSGDCLAGAAAGLVARGCSAFDAARMAALLVCHSADRLWPELGPGYLPEDIIAGLPASLRELLPQADMAWPPQS